MDRPDLDQCRALLDQALALAHAHRSLERFVGPKLTSAALAAALEPIVGHQVVISWIACNGDRVDAVLEAGELHWRVVFGSSDRVRFDWISVTARPDRFEGIEGGRAVVLNGPSGAGKSTLMAAIQTIADDPWVIFDEPENLGSVKPGYLIWRDVAPQLHAGYLSAIASLAGAGNYVAVAAGGHGQAEFRDHLGAVPTLWIGLYCDRSSLLQREQRSGRWAGIVDSSLGIHDGWTYDMTFDTSEEPDPRVFAARVIDAVDVQRGRQ